MADVVQHERVKLPAQQVWDVIGEFGGIRRWASIVQDEQVEDTPDGPVRVLTMANGNVVRESLVASSQYSYTYTYVDRPESASYRGTVAVVPIDAARARSCSAPRWTRAATSPRRPSPSGTRSSWPAT